MSKPEENWTLHIKPKASWFEINFKEIWTYRDLTGLLVKRDWNSQFKQTILGPLWSIGQPLLTTLIFTVVFSKMVRISTEGVPPHIFYLCGLLPWNLFSTSFAKISNTLSTNASIFGKVYFPRLVVPLSYIISGLISFSINLVIFIGLFIISIISGHEYHINTNIYMVPVCLLLVLIFSIGFGLIVSSLTIKYKDLNFLMAFAIQLLMYASPIIYPLSMVPEKYRIIILLNPLAAPIETFRSAMLGIGSINGAAIIYSTIICLLLLGLGLISFNRTEKTFIDSI